jgi:hypothetical protein
MFGLSSVYGFYLLYTIGDLKAMDQAIYEITYDLYLRIKIGAPLVPMKSFNSVLIVAAVARPYLSQQQLN